MIEYKRNTSEKTLPENEQSKYQAIVDEIDEDMSFSEQMTLLTKAWDMLPEPKLDWDYSVSLLRFFCMTCIEHEEFNEGEKWIKRLLESPYTEIDADPFEYGGIIFYKTNKLNEALQMLRKFESLTGNRGIRSLPPDVRKFYQEYKAK
jgi:hypothetical protein